MPISAAESSALAVSSAVGQFGERDIAEVPFVELSDCRLQGVVSSGSDIERVYCAYVEAASLNYHSSTNNNRPDMGTAKRIRWLVEAACAQHGVKRVARFLQLTIDAEEPNGHLERDCPQGPADRRASSASRSRRTKWTHSAAKNCGARSTTRTASGDDAGGRGIVGSEPLS